jgi:hypothetical protein
MVRYLIFALLLLGTQAGHARGVYQSPEAFLAEVFGETPPEPAVIWLTGEVRDGYERIMEGRPPQLRLRYWAQEARSTWILEAIGKEEPITAGFVVAEGRLERVKVLEFRESRGWEVRYPFFTNQFPGAGLNGDERLDRAIDGISGATLSVRAMDRMARLALFLHKQVVKSP